MTTADPLQHLAHTQRLAREAAELVAKINAVAQLIETETDLDVLRTFHLLPRTEQLDEIDEFARHFTRDDTYRLAPAQDRAYLTAVRCAVHDAVHEARQINYRSALGNLQRAQRELNHVRNRKRTGKVTTLPEPVRNLLIEASNKMQSFIAMFLDADAALTTRQGVLV